MNFNFYPVKTSIKHRYIFNQGNNFTAAQIVNILELGDGGLYAAADDIGPELAQFWHAYMKHWLIAVKSKDFPRVLT